MTQTTPASVASAILKRRNERQRFDSADFAMAQQQQKQQMQRLRLLSCDETASRNAPAPTTSRASSDDFSDWVQCELEPEPDSMMDAAASSGVPSSATVVPPQQVQRIRLQRFDSADWAMQNHKGVEATATTSLAGAVAKLRLERHAYATCSFLSTPIDPPAQHFVKNA